MRRSYFIAGAAGALALAFAARTPAASQQGYEVNHTDAEWHALLGDARFQILRRGDTETPGTSPLNAEARTGTYACYGCNEQLFSSAWKYDPGEGWPSFTSVVPGSVRFANDYSLLDARTEVHCNRCGGHLGHRFNDGPKPPDYWRYCIDGLALRFTPKG